MNLRLTAVLALLVAGLFPATAIYTWQNRTEEAFGEQEAVNIAVHFLRNCPTFRYDGIPASIRVRNVSQARTIPPTWIVVLEFQNRQTGYGDRTGMMLGQAITPHEIEIAVQEGRVVSAIVDGRWDELHQRKLVRSE